MTRRGARVSNPSFLMREICVDTQNRKPKTVRNCGKEIIKHHEG
jgi:hypothetical protein